ncbi:hypothetical protein DE4585_03858 [Mycobacteroides salmoniphilum]|uniref:DUF2628 domain-containing protein n=1 Tax=Mycobacteroides salmoniphilum TaxID=404941 RepID=A0A4R8RZW7_9MYCO|nr:DUF2628 domain-containing protein [Mycobacteroides salmoniphilum]TDZ80107.1 hypothetical protein DE4585_03858 [Mycobacteroides salmoniphilum]
MSQADDRAGLASIWQWRFGFYDQYGHPGSTPESEAVYRALPFGARLMLGCNILAFFFGPIYYFVKGMWRKGLTALSVMLAIGTVLYAVDASETMYQAASAGIGGVLTVTANYSYYLDRVKGSQSWNPFEGMKRWKWRT